MVQSWWCARCCCGGLGIVKRLGVVRPHVSNKNLIKESYGYYFPAFIITARLIIALRLHFTV